MLGIYSDGELAGCARLEAIVDEDGRKGYRAGLGSVRPDLKDKGVTYHIMDGCEEFIFG